MMMSATRTVTTATRAPDDLSNCALLDFTAAAGEADEEGEEEEDVLVEVATSVDELEALSATCVMSIGIISGLLPALPKLTDPSAAITSGLDAKKLRMYMML